MFQGEAVDPSPADNHTQHIAKHSDFLTRMTTPQDIGFAGIQKSIADGNPGLIGRIQSHIDEHKQAQAGKANFGAFSPAAAQQQPGQPQNLGPQAPAQSRIQQQSGFAQQQSGDAQSELSSILNSSGVNFG